MSKICIVTGASSGMGRGIALTLATEAGATVYATARRLEVLNQLADEAAKDGGVIHPVTLDQSDDAAVADFVAMVMDREEGVDLLVNSAYGGFSSMIPHLGKPFWERPVSVFDAPMNIGLRSTFVMSRMVAPHMVARGSGLMVQVSGFGGYTYLFEMGYGISKAGIDRLSADMAAEMNGHGVRALTLYPGAAVSEVTAFPGGETTGFAGRSVAALLNKASEADLDAMNGKVVMTMELAKKYGFTDLDGALPAGPFSDEAFAASCRGAMSQTPVQYDQDGALPDTSETNSSDMAAMFPGA